MTIQCADIYCPKVAGECPRCHANGPNIPMRGRYEGPVMGCVCPAGAERTCRGPMCPRQPIPAAT